MWCLYALTQAPEVQRKLLEELRTRVREQYHAPGRPLDHEALDEVFECALADMPSLADAEDDWVPEDEEVESQQEFKPGECVEDDVEGYEVRSESDSDEDAGLLAQGDTEEALVEELLTGSEPAGSSAPKRKRGTPDGDSECEEEQGRCEGTDTKRQRM